MKLKYLTITIFILTLSMTFSQTKITVNPINVKQSSGVYVNKGDKLSISASGQWKLWDKYNLTDAMGHDIEATSYGNWGLLLGQIGNSDPFIIGTTTELEAENEGVLYLFPNAGNYLISNEEGSLEVTVDGGIKLENFIETISSNAHHFEFDPTKGTLSTNLYFNQADSIEIYAFGGWTMWKGQYPIATPDGHEEFKTDGVKWGKLFAGIGNSRGQNVTSYPVGEKSEISAETSGILNLFPFINNYVSDKEGKIDVYIIGGNEATEEQISESNMTTHDVLSENALTRLNYYRKEAGLGELEIDETLNTAALSHAGYLILNNKFTRYQEEEDSVFYATTPEDRVKKAGYNKGKVREMFCETESETHAVDVLFNTVYHRLRLMNPTLKYVGYGSYKMDNRVIHVFDFGYDETISADSDYYHFPGNLTKDITPIWNGLEEPAPFSEEIEKPVGSPVTILFTEEVASIDNVALKIESTDEDVDFILISDETDINNRQINSAILVPKSPLEVNTRYIVQLDVTYTNEDSDNVKFLFQTGESED